MLRNCRKFSPILYVIRLKFKDLSTLPSTKFPSIYDGSRSAFLPWGEYVRTALIYEYFAEEFSEWYGGRIHESA